MKSKGESGLEETQARHILYRKKDTGWFGSDYNFNLYRGCPHGCIYCDSRSQCYGITDFSKVRVKKDALSILHTELRSCRKTGVAATGSMSDPYNPMERQYEFTRSALNLLDTYGFGTAIATKGSLVTRDIDVLSSIQSHSPVIVKITVTTPHDELSRWIEPCAPSSSQRLEVLHTLSKAEIFAGVLLMPVLPFLEDREEDIKMLVKLCAEKGAKFIYPYFGVTLRDRQREYFLAKVREYSQDIWKQYLDYEEDYSCLCPNHRTLWAVFEQECRKYGILWRMKDIIQAYQKPYEMQQLSLL